MNGVCVSVHEKEGNAGLGIGMINDVEVWNTY